MNRTVVEYREARAVELSLQGLTYDQIAVELDYANRSGPWKAVRRCLARRADAAAHAHIAASLVDLDVIEERAWPRAVAGDLAASRIVLRAMEARMRLLELLSRRDTQGGKRQKAASTVGAGTKRRPEPGAESGVFTSMVV
jgi:hypothetical protein